MAELNLETLTLLEQNVIYQFGSRWWEPIKLFDQVWFPKTKITES